MKFNTTQIVTSIILIVVLVLTYFGLSLIMDMDQKKEVRTKNKQKIDLMIAERYNGTIVESELDGHCGIALYEIKVRDGNKQIHELYFNMDSGEQLAGEITDNCDDLLKVVK